MNFDIFALIVIPLMIFFARIIDVSLQTLRIIFISRDRIKLTPIVGFFEVFIWLLAIGQIFSHLTNIFYYFAYAAGFATGSYIGIYIERKLSINLINLQLIIKKNPDQLLNSLKNSGYGLTTFTAEGRTGAVRLIILIIKRKNLDEVLTIIEKSYPNAFISIEQVQSVKGGMFPSGIKYRKH